VIINPLPPSNAFWKHIFLEELFSSVLSQKGKYHHSKNLKFNNLGIFKSLKLHNLIGKILGMYLKLHPKQNILETRGKAL